MSIKKWTALKIVQNGSLKATGRLLKVLKLIEEQVYFVALRKCIIVVSVCHSFVTELTDNYNYVTNKDIWIYMN